MSISFRFDGRIALVTGGARGIGQRIARDLQAGGATVHVFDLSSFESDGITGHLVDVTDTDAITRALAGIGPRVDILVNNAGFTGGTTPVTGFDPVHWRRVIEVNLNAVFEMCRQVVPLMEAHGYGRIVNMASLAGKAGTPGLSAYSAAKAGVIAFTKSLARELADTDLRANSVAPAAVDTEILRQMAPEAVQTMIDKSPLGRLGNVAEISTIVQFLCSEECSFNVGATFDASGGRLDY